MTQPLPRGERTRLDIIHVAYQLFIDQGYHGTSMRQIANEAGVALGGIYNHFDSKEDIFATVLDTYHPYHEILPALLSGSEGDSVEEFLKGAANQMATALEQRPGFLNLVFIEFVEFNGQHFPGLIDTAFPQMMHIAQRFLIAPDTLRPIPAPIIVRTFLGLFFSYAITEMILSDEFPSEFQENALEGMIDIFLHGILA